MPGMLQALGDRTSRDRGGEEKAVKGKLSNSASEFGLFLNLDIFLMYVCYYYRNQMLFQKRKLKLENKEDNVPL